MPEIRKPRTVHNYSETTSSQLHIFVDPSLAAMAAVTYLRTTTGQTSPPQACFLMVKQKSMPKMELEAADIGVRLLHRDPKGNDNDNRPKFSLVRQSNSFGLDSPK